MARSAGQHVLFRALRAFVVIFEYPRAFLLMCFDVVLTNNVARTSFELY